jgi:uncharacterized SAM-binding protein YcdF (DUF218 family)
MDDVIRGTVARQSTAVVGTRRRAGSDVVRQGLAEARLHPVPRQEGLRSALVLWDYLCLDVDPEAADCIFVMGGHDKGVAEHAARLYCQGLAPLVAVSGGIVNPPSMLERGAHQASEAQELADVLIAGGVPSELVLLENRATNSGENFRFTDELFAERELAVESAVIVTKPYCERRGLATARMSWPARATTIGAHRRSFYDYLKARIPLERVLSMMVGEVDRLRTYGERNFIAPVTVPLPVLAAAEVLRREGYTARGIPA